LPVIKILILSIFSFKPELCIVLWLARVAQVGTQAGELRQKFCYRERG